MKCPKCELDKLYVYNGACPEFCEHIETITMGRQMYYYNRKAKQIGEAQYKIYAEKIISWSLIKFLVIVFAMTWLIIANAPLILLTFVLTLMLFTIQHIIEPAIEMAYGDRDYPKQQE